MQTHRKNDSGSAEIALTIDMLNKEERRKHLNSLSGKRQYTQGFLAIIGDSDNMIVFKQKIMLETFDYICSLLEVREYAI